ncbi:MAG: hypothetical protein KGD65_02990 [Candidatus Lokiarchaeota archaeon]|nr:hypothetical protein [Candidatus Lokiarchaeota archaeon]
MGKDKKALGIKTARYFTKNCAKCGFEYPNWFTNCPKCGTAWDELEAKAFTPSTETHKKTIKIVVKITEEDFNRAILKVNLIFSADQGKSWYQMLMDSKTDFYLAEIAEIPAGAIIIYYIEVHLEDGEKIIENNDNKYFYYKVGVSVGEPEEKPSELERNELKGKIRETKIKPQSYAKDPVVSQIPKTQVTRKVIKSSTEVSQELSKSDVVNNPPKPSLNNLTIFGKPQTTIDPELKICTHCNSKIKKMWSICPICGKDL